MTTGDSSTRFDQLRDVQAPGDPVQYRLILDSVEQAMFPEEESRTLVIDRYVVRDKLGAGGRGVVYRAKDPELERDVAIKLVRLDGESGTDSDVESSLLLREAKAIARLAHPNVVNVFDAGTMALAELMPEVPPDELPQGDSCAYVVMELVEGQTLREWLDDRNPGWREILEKFVGAAHGLMAAHGVEIVHRDFKPSNVIIGADGRARVLDFGVAHLGRDDAGTSVASLSIVDDEIVDEEASDLSRTGVVAGTPAYMAPEQHAGQRTDWRVDQYAFCVALFEALFGARPFSGDTMAEIESKKKLGEIDPVPRRQAIPRAVTRAVEQGLAPDPEDRHPSMEALVRVLERALTPRYKRLIVPGAALSVAAAATLYALVSVPSEDNPADCGRPAADLSAEAWNPDLAARIEARFEEVAPTYADAVWRTVRGTLDRYTDEWRQARDGVCEQPGAPESTAALQCLEARRNSLLALTQVLADGDEGVVRRAANAADVLPSVATCTDPDAAKEVARLGTADAEAMARATALSTTGQLPEAKKAVAEVVEALEARGEEPSPGLLHVRGRLQHQLGDYEKAAEFYAQAETRAESLGNEYWALRTQIDRASLKTDRGRVEDAFNQLRVAEARLKRFGRSRELEYAYHWAGARIAFDQRKPAETRRHLDALWDLSRTSSREKEKVDLQMFEGIVQMTAGKPVEAADTLSALLRQERVRLGREHPSLALIHLNLGATLTQAGDPKGGVRESARAGEIYGVTTAPSHPALLATLINEAEAYRALGNTTTALERANQAIARLEHVGENNQFAAAARAAHAQTLRDRGDLPRALEEAKRALSTRREVLGKTNPDTLNSMAQVAELALLAGQHEYARAMLDDAADGLKGAELDERRAEPWMTAALRASWAAAVGKKSEAEEYLASAPPQWAEVPANLPEQFWVLEKEAELAMRLGNQDAARKRTRSLLALLDAGRAGAPGLQVRAQVIRARVALLEGDRGGAVIAVDEALELADRGEVDGMARVQAHLAAAKVHASTDPKKARAQRRAAETMLDELDVGASVRALLTTRW